MPPVGFYLRGDGNKVVNAGVSFDYRTICMKRNSTGFDLICFEFLIRILQGKQGVFEVDCQLHSKQIYSAGGIQVSCLKSQDFWFREFHHAFYSV